MSNKLMFMYESLSDYKKEMIDDEIESKIKDMVISNRSFEYSHSMFHAMLNKLIIYGERTNEFLGYNDDFFGVKELAVKSRAINIAHKIEHNRPHKELIECYIELCKVLMFSPDIELFFDRRFASEVVYSLSKEAHRRNRILYSSGEVVGFEIVSSKKHLISSNITNFEELFKELYIDADNRLIAPEFFNGYTGIKTTF